MSKEFAFDEESYFASVHKEVREEILANDPVEKRCRYVSFVSRSRGKGKRRAPREVNLLVIDEMFTYQVKEGSPVRKKAGSLAADVLAIEILSDVPERSERSVALLLERVKANRRLKS